MNLIVNVSMCGYEARRLVRKCGQLMAAWEATPGILRDSGIRAFSGSGTVCDFCLHQRQHTVPLDTFASAWSGSGTTIAVVDSPSTMAVEHPTSR